MQVEYDDTILIKRAGDVLRLVATISLLLTIWDSKKSTGFSGKSQMLYAIVYTTRYLGAYVGDVIVLNAFEIVLRCTLVMSSYAIVYLIYKTYRYNSSRNEDSTRIIFILLPCLLLSLLYNPGFSNNFFVYDELLLIGFPFVEVCWAFSYYLESVAIVPQLWLLHSAKIYDKQSFVAGYLLIMGLSRVMYTVHSIWERKHDVITDATGAVQFCIYLAYFIMQIEVNQVKSDRNELLNVDV